METTQKLIDIKGEPNKARFSTIGWVNYGEGLNQMKKITFERSTFREAYRSNQRRAIKIQRLDYMG